MGVDYGTRRMGFAVSDPEGVLAVVLGTAEVRSEAEALSRVRERCVETGAQRVVVGLPVKTTGVRGDMALRAEAFARRVAGETGLPVDMWDERLTTSMAERVLLEADVSRARRRQARDKMAAQILLQDYLDARRTDASVPDSGAGSPT